MRINLYIERLVLDGVPQESSSGPLLQAAVEAELTRLLAAAGLGESLTSGGAWHSVRTPSIQLAADGGPAQLGQRIAEAVYGGIGT